MRASYAGKLSRSTLDFVSVWQYRNIGTVKIGYGSALRISENVPNRTLRPQYMKWTAHALCLGNDE
ncbi:hypothetical protein GCM10008985_14970 [Halococcus dombrowskii]|uniref:Uncharacterized protein n=1 Tax=Halococcus dombrowskii TaxID=179637 RepID=A0AAV3SFG9_HALDO